MAPLSNTQKHILAIFLIVSISIIIYSNSFDCSFHFDDQTSIIENHTIQDFDIKRMLSSPRPVVDFSLALNYYLGELNVFGYHLFNLLLHIANGVMLYFILFWTTNLPSMQKKYGERAYRIALYAALIFVAHPIQTQAVTYIISRSSVMATTFYLLTLLLFVRAESGERRAESEEDRRQKIEDRGQKSENRGQRAEVRGLRSSLFALRSLLKAPRSSLFALRSLLIVASCLGMATKQIAATIPAMILIYDFYFISDGNWKVLKKHYKVHLAIFSTLIVVFYINVSLLDEFVSFDYGRGADVGGGGDGGVHMPYADPLTSFQYFLTQLHVIPYYIKLLFIPTNLNLDYDWPVTRVIDLPTVGFFFLLVAILAFGIAVFRRSRLLSFAILWFFVTLSVTSSFVVIYDMIFEHRLYLPSVGFAILGALAIGSIGRRGESGELRAESEE